MNTKNNRRKKESREKLEGAFMEVLESKDLNQISVSELCKRAGLNRSTFYANYLDIYDLADKVKARVEAEVNQLYARELAMSYNSNDFLKLFRHIRDHQLFYKTCFKLGYDSSYQITRYDTHLTKLYFDDRYVEYHIEFFRAGFNQIVRMWLDRGCPETPEEINEVLLSEYRGRASTASAHGEELPS